ncbi:MAG: sulfatase [Rikenellaceae bacterium]
MYTKQILSGTALTLSLLSSGVCQAAPKQPNVLIILVDDLGWNDLGFMGSEYYESPNIDKLASQGMQFSNAYAACQVSSPSRASILTGKYTTNHGVTNFLGAPTGEAWRKKARYTKMLPPQYAPNMSLEESTLPEYLKENGYKTFMAGKWHLGGEGSHPEDHGFDINKGGWDTGSPVGGYFSPWQNPKLPNEIEGENLSMRLSRETVDFIADHTKKNKKQPFFAFLSFHAVHSPIQTTEEKWSYFRDKAEEMGIKEEGFRYDGAMPVRQNQDNPVYAGLIQQMDDAVGVVLDALEEMGVDENTMIIFTSDNGGVVSGDNFSTSLKPLRGGKGMQWEGGIRVPMIIRTPSGEGAGVVCDTPVSGIDCYPTIVDYIGLPQNTNQAVDGVSVMPLVKGEEIAERPLYWHYPHYGNQGGEPSGIIRDGEWKLIRYYEDDRLELYNLRIDLSELEPLNHLYPQKVKELSAKLDCWLEECGAIMPTGDPEYSPQKEAALKEQWRTSALKSKERERQNMLKPDWKPNDNWWSSKITVD